MNNKRGRRRGTRPNAQEKSALETVVADFVACGRCSFFLSGYRVIHGEDALKQASEERDENWLTLRWDRETKRLVQASYGSRLDIAFTYYDGRCPECQRRYVIGAVEEHEEDERDVDEGWVEGAEGAGEPAEPSSLRIALTSF